MELEIKTAKETKMGNLQGYTTAELGLALIKHQEGRVILPAKMRKEIEQEIKHRAARGSN